MKKKFLFLPLLAFTVLISTAAYVPLAESTEPAPLLSEEMAPAFPALMDTLPQGTHEATRMSNGKTTKVRVEDGQITELEIDGQPIPEAEYENHEPLAEELLGIKSDSSWTDFDGKQWSFHFPEEEALLLKGLAQRTQSFESFREEAMEKVQRLEGIAYNLDSLARINQRAMKRVNLDSLLATITQSGIGSMDLDSLTISWGLDTSEFRGLRFQSPNTMRWSNESDMEYIERQEEALREQLRALEAQKESLKEQKKALKDRRDGLGD